MMSMFFMLMGIIGVCYGWWNLTFGAQDWRGFVVTLLGCIVFGYGLNEMWLWSIAS